jgi:hypothetical protein
LLLTSLLGLSNLLALAGGRIESGHFVVWVLLRREILRENIFYLIAELITSPLQLLQLHHVGLFGLTAVAGFFCSNFQSW